MTDKPTIYELIPRVMNDIGAIGKDSTNQQQGFKFRGIEAVVNGISNALIKNGVFYSPTTLSVEYGTLTTNKGTTMRTCAMEVQFRFFGPAGDYFDAVVYGESADMGDKSTSKAISMAQKYALCNVFNITTQDMEDADSTTPDEGTHSPSPRANTTTENRTIRKPPAKKPMANVVKAVEEFSTSASEAMRRTLLNRASRTGMTEAQIFEFTEKEVGKTLDDANLSVDDVNKLLALLADPGRTF